MALACRPVLLIADEPTTALDVTIQAQILDLLRALQNDLGMALLLITHDLGVIAEMADEVAVMYAGRIVEQAPVAQLFQQPKHPYTQGLLASIPTLEASKHERLRVIKGGVPNLARLPAGCTFAPRCPHVMDVCRQDLPALKPVAERHVARCWLY
jgi:peptide/nickel transport system ATP-binding protein